MQLPQKFKLVTEDIESASFDASWPEATVKIQSHYREYKTLQQLERQRDKILLYTETEGNPSVFQWD